MKAYISGALTGLNNNRDYRKIYEAIGQICKECKIDSYVPHLFADPIKSPEIPASEVWQRDHDQVMSSEITIAYVGQPSLGVGAELEIARIYKKKLIIWHFENEKVSRMALGNPAVRSRIIAKDENDLYIKLKKELA